MQYGIGRIDLNLRARLALMGFSDTPGRDIAALFKSQQPIEAETRARLAEALEGKDSGIQLTVVGKSDGKVIRAMQLRRRNAQIGREVSARIPDIGYEQAASEGAVKHSMGTKSIMAHVALHRKIIEWIGDIREAKVREDLSDFALELVFIYADATKQEPIDCLRPSANKLADFFAEIDELWQKTGLRRRP